MRGQLADADAAALDLGHNLVFLDGRVVEGEVFEDVGLVAVVGVRRLVAVVILLLRIPLLLLLLLRSNMFNILYGVILRRVVSARRVIVNVLDVVARIREEVIEHCLFVLSGRTWIATV
jgi:hypothetical protein